MCSSSSKLDAVLVEKILDGRAGRLVVVAMLRVERRQFGERAPPDAGGLPEQSHGRQEARIRTADDGRREPLSGIYGDFLDVEEVISQRVPVMIHHVVE